MDLPGLVSPQGGERIALGIAKSGSQPGNGYSLSLEAADSPKGSGSAAGWRCRLAREGKTLWERLLDSGTRVESISARRKGGYVITALNGEAHEAYRDEDPLGGARVAFLARGLHVDPSRPMLPKSADPLYTAGAPRRGKWRWTWCCTNG